MALDKFSIELGELQHIRTAQSLTESHKRYSFKATHSFRKYFETKCLKKMKLLNVKLLMGHDTGLEKSYYKPSESHFYKIICKP